MDGYNYLRYPVEGQTIDFRLGINRDWSSEVIHPGQCTDLNNFNITSVGRLSSRGGTRKENATQIDTSKPVLDMYKYYKSDGTTQFLVHVNATLYTLSGDTATSKLATLPATRPLRWLTWNNKAYGFGGATIFSWDGTTATKIASANCPDLTCGAVNLSKLWGFAELSSNPSLLYYSNSLDAETWGATDYFRLRDNDGDVGKDVVAVAGGSLLALKSTSAWIIDGSEIYDFAKVLESDQIGLHGYTLSSYDGGAIWLSNRGVCYWNPRESRQFHLISNFGVTNEILNVGSTVLDKAYGHYSPKTRRYYLSINGVNFQKVYVFHFDLMHTDTAGYRVPCSTYTYSVPTGPFISFDGKGDNGELYFGGIDNGYVYQADYDFLDEQSATIAITATLKDNDFGIDNKKKLRIVDQRYQAGSSITSEVILDYGKKIISKTFVATIEGAIFGTDVFGTGVFGADRFNTRVSKFTKSNFITLQYKISGNISTSTEIAYPVFRYYPLDILKTRE